MTPWKEDAVRACPRIPGVGSGFLGTVAKTSQVCETGTGMLSHGPEGVQWAGHFGNLFGRFSQR